MVNHCKSYIYTKHLLTTCPSRLRHVNIKMAGCHDSLRNIERLLTPVVGPKKFSTLNWQIVIIALETLNVN